MTPTAIPTIGIPAMLYPPVIVWTIPDPVGGFALPILGLLVVCLFVFGVKYLRRVLEG